MYKEYAYVYTNETLYLLYYVQYAKLQLNLSTID